MCFERIDSDMEASMVTSLNKPEPTRGDGQSNDIDRFAVGDLRDMSLRGLKRMFLSTERMFCHCIRRTKGVDSPEGISRRYTAITLLGLAGESEDRVRQILEPHDAQSVCGRLLEDVDSVNNLGDVALTLWAACALNHSGASRAFDRLVQLDPIEGGHPTVELSWVLRALVAHGQPTHDGALAERMARRLLANYRVSTGLFPHMPDGAPVSKARAHVACFADLVYPIQALCAYYESSRDEEALAAAKGCGARMIEGQGPEGQWWWHHDIRTGTVVEGYPVYSVHQDSMAVMALFALRDACGFECDAAVVKGLDWLRHPSEVGSPLVDTDADLIWRKLGRKEPGKLSRGLQAMASKAHPSLRVPGVDVVMPPGRIDYECRPYHLGWILFAFSKKAIEKRQ
jgi:hypothetical protein